MEVKSMAQARRKIKEAQAQANAERIKRERDNVEDAAVVMVELGKIGAVDSWEAEQLREVQVEAERRRDERRREAATAVRRMQDRGETLTAISELVGAPVAELRALTKTAAAVHAAAADERGAGNAPSGALGAEAEGTADAVEVAAPHALGAQDLAVADEAANA
jgi:hypothetical protein